MSAPSGEQVELVHGAQHVVVVEVGGGVRSYTDGDRDVLQPYDVDAMCDGAHGAPLIPWPNRLGEGRYTFDGVEHQVPLNEPEKRNAIHGFLRWRSFTATGRTPSSVTMTATLHPLPGYPFALDVALHYALDDDGLTVTTTATNVGAGALPYACGQHPYLSPGDGTVDSCELQLTAATRIDTDPQRQLPTGTEPVAGTRYDFREPRRIGDLEMDFAFTDLDRDDDGRAWLRLHRPDGVLVELWVDEAYPVLEAYTADTLAPERRRQGLGAEPMTLPPNGLQTGEQVVRLEPGAAHTAAWGVRLREH